ncbi:MAG TPA: LysE family transporter [Methylomirabilota bacterium]|nr:LysE family transporter [Methylomirabilota bacterium]
MLAYFLRGLVIGFSIAAPVGPIGLLCIRRTLADGRAVGFVSGLGAATADAAYGAVAGFGLTALSGFLVRWQTPMRLIGGVFLCYLGVRTFLARPASRSAERESRGLIGAYLSTLGLTLTNPSTILSFVAIFAGLGLGTTGAAGGGDYAGASMLVGGVFVGSAAWWLILSGITGAVRGRFSPAGMRWVNRLSGAILTAFGLAALFALG